MTALLCYTFAPENLLTSKIVIIMEKVMTSKEIVSAIVKESGMSIRAFSRKMGINYSRVFDICNGRVKKIASDIERAIINTYKVNPNFLKTGKGMIYGNEECLTENIPLDSSTNDPLTQSFLTCLREISKRKNLLEDEVRRLRAELMKLSMENTLLKSEIDALKMVQIAS